MAKRKRSGSDGSEAPVFIYETRSSARRSLNASTDPRKYPNVRDTNTPTTEDTAESTDSHDSPSSSRTSSNVHESALKQASEFSTETKVTHQERADVDALSPGTSKTSPDGSPDRPGRRRKPTQKAAELAANSSSKLFKTTGTSQVKRKDIDADSLDQVPAADSSAPISSSVAEEVTQRVTDRQTVKQISDVEQSVKYEDGGTVHEAPVQDHVTEKNPDSDVMPHHSSIRGSSVKKLHTPSTTVAGEEGSTPNTTEQPYPEKRATRPRRLKQTSGSNQPGGLATTKLSPRSTRTGPATSKLSASNTDIEPTNMTSPRKTPLNRSTKPVKALSGRNRVTQKSESSIASIKGHPPASSSEAQTRADKISKDHPKQSTDANELKSSTPVPPNEPKRPLTRIKFKPLRPPEPNNTGPKPSAVTPKHTTILHQSRSTSNKPATQPPSCNLACLSDSTLFYLWAKITVEHADLADDLCRLDEKSSVSDEDEEMKRLRGRLDEILQGFCECQHGKVPTVEEGKKGNSSSYLVA